MAFGKILRVRVSAMAVAAAAVAVSATIGASAVGAQDARAVGVTPPRLSFIDGEVSYWRPGAEDWGPAQINTALAAGDSLYAGESGNVEVEIGTRAYVRAGSGTELGVESLETGYLQLRVPSGHAALDLKRLPDGQTIEVGTPNGAFLIEHIGYYRFDVDEQSTRFSSRKGGVARVVPAGSAELEIGSSQDVIVTGTETASIQRVAPSADDAWDRWNYDRTAQLGPQPRSEQYVSPDVAGVDDLDRYGDWRETPKYGNVWVPRDVGGDWAPYSDGRWVWDGYYGWTWVDYSPWGWAPYHYGRWCWNDGYWGWAPGPVIARPAYSPALVAFFGGGGVGVSVSVGTPFVSWVALGYGEPVVPWWGPRGFVGRPYWGGWGGRRYVNNVQINNTTIINVNNINRYDNFRNRRAVIGVEGDRFGRGGRSEHVRVDSGRLRNLRPVRGELGIKPVRESLVARSGRSERPPDRIQNRRVVATRAPQDPARQPRAAGLVQPNSRRQPEPRIVTPTRERSQGRDLRRDRNAPPARGGVDRGTVGERGQGRIDTPDVKGRAGRPEAVERGSGGEPNRIERVPSTRGEDGAMRRGAQPPSTKNRAPSERDRNGREVQQPGTRGGDANIAPPTGSRSREVKTPRESGPPQDPGGNAARERGRSRVEQPERTREVAPPRQERQQPKRMEQPQQRAPEAQRMEAPKRSERSSGGEPRQVRQPSVERQQAPRPERQEAPRVERQQAPRPERQEAPRVERQQAPRPERQQAPRVERQQAPRVERGGGDPRGSNEQRGGGGSRQDGGGDRKGRNRD